MSHARASAVPDKGVARPVSRPGDAAEREADRAADVVATGGSVRGWSLATSPPGAGVQRQDGAGSKDEKKAEDPNRKEYEEAAKKTGEALLKTEAGKALQKQVLESPEVKKVTKFATSPAGIAIGATAIAGGVTGLALAGKELPFQPPTIPLDRITPGLSADVKVEGPLNAPTFVGLTITFKPKAKEKSRRRSPEKAEPSPLVPKRSAAEEQQLSEAAIDYAVRQMTTRHPLGVPVMKLDLSPRAGEGKPDESAPPVQRATDTTTDDHGPSAAHVDDGFAGSGRPLDDRVRATMETRFGHDFSAVRLHDDARANAAADRVDARAFTVGDDIVLGAGSDATAPHLLAHELAHVVQQRGEAGHDRGHVARLGALETLARFFGGGTFSDDELTTYLETIRRTGEILDDYDSDNMAREIVARFVRGASGWDVLTVPDRVLLIREMISGATLGGDERAILQLLQEAIPSERVVIVGEVGLATLRDNFSGANLRELNELVEAGEEDVAFGALGSWTVEGVLQRVARHGDESAIRELLDRGYTVIRFKTAFDRWRYHDDNRVEEHEVRGLRGNTDRDAKEIRLRDGLGEDAAAATLFHEIRHAITGQVATEDERLEDEIAARVATEEYLIRRGQPPTAPGYRRADGTVDEDFIRKEIRASDHYNPQDRTWLGRRYVDEQSTTGWHVPTRSAAAKATP